MKLNQQAIYCLNEAIIKLHDAARQVDENTADELGELANEVQFIGHSSSRKGCCFGGLCEYNPPSGGCTFLGYCKFQF